MDNKTCGTCIYCHDDQDTGAPFCHRHHEFVNRSSSACPNYSSSSYSSSSGSSGCYVATAVYGSYDCPEVWTLRRYRDNVLAKSIFGRTFIRVYYAVSPTAVKLFGKRKWFNRLFRSPLDRFVKKLTKRGIESTPYEDKVVKAK